MNESATRRFATLGSWLFGTNFVILIGLSVCWAGLRNVDQAEEAPAMLALVVASLYLAIASFIAAAIFRSCDSPMAFRFFNLAAVAALSGLAGPLAAALIWRS